jgi:hypothetical protein
MERLLLEQRCRKLMLAINPERASGLEVSFELDDFPNSFCYRPIVNPSGREHFDQCYVPVA